MDPKFRCNHLEHRQFLMHEIRIIARPQRFGVFCLRQDYCDWYSDAYDHLESLGIIASNTICSIHKNTQYPRELVSQHRRQWILASKSRPFQTDTSSGELACALLIHNHLIHLGSISAPSQLDPSCKSYSPDQNMPNTHAKHTRLPPSLPQNPYSHTQPFTSQLDVHDLPNSSLVASMYYRPGSLPLHPPPSLPPFLLQYTC
jgi:hypothetical protein